MNFLSDVSLLSLYAYIARINPSSRGIAFEDVRDSLFSFVPIYLCVTTLTIHSAVAALSVEWVHKNIPGYFYEGYAIRV